MVVRPRNLAQPTVKLASIVAASLPGNEDRLQARIVERATGVGADAVTLVKVDVLESMGSSPLYVSTLSPADTGTTHTRGAAGGGW